MGDIVDKYCKAFKSLNVSVKEGTPAPHKPVLLLTVINFIEAKAISDDRIYLTKELEFSFNSLWSRLVGDDTRFRCNIALPFYHMNSEFFWNLVKSPIYEKRDTYNIAALKSSFEYATIDKDLFELLQDKTSRAKLRVLLISYYFSRIHGLDFDYGSKNKVRANIPRESTSPKILDNTIYIEEYGDRSFIVCGPTKPIKDELKSAGGFFRPNANNGRPAWIFSNNKRKDVETLLSGCRGRGHDSPTPTSVRSNWRIESPGYRFVAEQLALNTPRKEIVRLFNLQRENDEKGFSTSRGCPLTQAILSIWEQEIRNSKYIDFADVLNDVSKQIESHSIFNLDDEAE